MSAAAPACPRPLPPAHEAMLAVHPDGALAEVPLRPGTSAASVLLGMLDCPLPYRFPLTSRLDMWAVGDAPRWLPCNLLALGMGRRHGLPSRCYHGTVLLCGTMPGPGPAGPAGLSVDQLLAALTMIGDVADQL